MKKRHNCDLCGSNKSIEVPHCREYTKNEAIDICKGCGLVYVRNRRSTKEVANDWSKKLFGKHYTAFMPASKARQLYVADFINETIGLNNKKIVDIGGGEGVFLEIVRNIYNGEVFAIEPSEKNCKTIESKGFQCFHGTIEEYWAAYEAYQDIHPKAQIPKVDIVTIIWTMENTTDCMTMLNAANKILKPSGHIVIATGSRILVPFKKPLHLYFSKEPADTNCYKCSANTQQALLAKAGFKTVHINRYIDSDILCVVAKKTKEKVKWKGDDWKEVKNFFERWHKETQYYKVKK